MEGFSIFAASAEVLPSWSGQSGTGRDLGRTQLPDDEGRAWRRDLQAARKNPQSSR